MYTKTGYKEMLRDRCPDMVSKALVWCKAKEKWLQYVYKTWIWIYKSNVERLEATRLILGYKEANKRQFVFDETINWNDLTEEETKYWKEVSKTVKWFTISYSYVLNLYQISMKVGKPMDQIKLSIMTNYLRHMCPTNKDDAETKARKNKEINDFTDYLISCFEKEKYVLCLP